MSQKKNRGATKNAPARGEAAEATPARGHVSARQGEMFPEAIAVSHSTSFHGPIPPPALLGEYEQMMPGLGEHIVTMAELEGNHRRTIENRLVLLSEGGLLAATMVALVIATGAMLLIWQDKTIGGLAAPVTALVALVTVYIVGGRRGPPSDTTAGENAGTG